MEKEFVPYELASRMKQLEFDEPCFRYIYAGDTGNNVDIPCEVLPSKAENFNEDYLCISTPTCSQAFRWFREKYHIIGEVKFKGGKTTQTAWYDYVIYSEIDWNDENPNEQWKKHEEAELACLKKLIEIVEKQKENDDMVSSDNVGY